MLGKKTFLKKINNKEIFCKQKKINQKIKNEKKYEHTSMHNTQNTQRTSNQPTCLDKLKVLKQ